MIDKTVWEPILEKLRAVTLIQPYSVEREMIRIYLEELRYRLWHQTTGILPKWCYATDIDFLEWTGCGGRIELRALIEIKSNKSTVWNRKKDWQLKIYQQLGEKLNIPVYLSTFQNDFSIFELEQLYPKQNKLKLTQQEYVNFLIKMHQWKVK